MNTIALIANLRIQDVLDILFLTVLALNMAGEQVSRRLHVQEQLL